jgi:hypothetical protein
MTRCGATFDENVELLVRPLTPERRLAVSYQDTRSPLGTAALTLRSHFQRERIVTSTPETARHAVSWLEVV